MKPKTMILMVVAVACGLVASYMTSRLLADRNTQTNEAMVDVVVAKKKVSGLTLIRKPEDLFEIRSVKDDGPITAKAIKSLDELAGKRLKNSLAEGAVVHVDDLQKKEDMILDVPPGQRAIAIKVDARSLAGGFILPGMRVDVLATIRNGDEPSAMILLQNMLVLAIDTNPNRDEGKTTMVGQTVTLAASPEECNRLVLAGDQGLLTLSLRSPDDKRLVTVSETRRADLRKTPANRDAASPEAEGGSETQGTVNGLPSKIDKEPAAPTPTVVVKEEKPAEKPAEKLQQHKMQVIVGAFSEQYVFTKDPETGEWRGRANRDDNDPAPKPPTGKQPVKTDPGLNAGNK